MKRPTKHLRETSAAETPATGGFNEAGAAFNCGGASIGSAGEGAAALAPPPAIPCAAPRKAFAKLADKFLAANRALHALEKSVWRCVDEGKPTEEITTAIDAASADCSEAEDRFAAAPALNQAELNLKIRTIAIAEGDSETTHPDGVELFAELMKSAFRDFVALDRTKGGIADDGAGGQVRNEKHHSSGDGKLLRLAMKARGFSSRLDVLCDELAAAEGRAGLPPWPDELLVQLDDARMGIEFPYPPGERIGPDRIQGARDWLAD